MDSTVLFEFGAVFLLILLNGFFSGSELAVISARKSTIARLISEGDDRAVVVEKLQKQPHSFLATVQVGISIVTTVSSVVGGNNAIKHLKPILAAAPYQVVRDSAETLSVTIVVITISYLTLIFGELAPKTIGLQYADRMSLLVAKPLSLLATSTSFAVKFLTWSNKVALRLFGVIPATGQEFVTREEVLHTVAECGETGVLTTEERSVIENMLDFGATVASEVMVPRMRMKTFSVDTPREELLAAVAEHCYTRYPVFEGDNENIIGFLHSKDLLLNAEIGTPGCNLKKAVRPLNYVPESQRANHLLRAMQQDRTQMALVVDEYGAVSGLVTIEDLLEELVGEIRDEYDEDEGAKLVELPDGSRLVDGHLSRNDLEEILDIKFEEGLPYDTIAGLILNETGHFPEKGDVVSWRGYRLVCVDVTPTCIKKVRIETESAAAA